MNKKCPFCGNKNFKDTAVQYTYKKDAKFLIINNVPCMQCEYCGEQYFQAPVLKKIAAEFEAIYSQGKSVKTEIRVPMEQFSDLQYPAH